MELTGLLGHAVVDAGGSELGRIVDLLADAQGRVRAVVVDVGGFMGLGNRKVAVAWSALRFAAGRKGTGDVDRDPAGPDQELGRLHRRPPGGDTGRARQRPIGFLSGTAARVARAELAVLFRRRPADRVWAVRRGVSDKP